jgi:hypothetical protein
MEKPVPHLFRYDDDYQYARDQVAWIAQVLVGFQVDEEREMLSMENLAGGALELNLDLG